MIALGIFTALVIAILSYASKAPTWIKLAVLPLFLVIVVLGYTHYVDLLGSPVPTRPVGMQHYVQHIITADKKIVIWVWSNERGHRLHRYPYNREDAAKLQQQAEGENGEGGKLNFADGEGFIEVPPSERQQPVQNLFPKSLDEDQEFNLDDIK